VNTNDPRKYWQSNALLKLFIHAVFWSAIISHGTCN
jgi:hypothetical protein